MVAAASSQAGTATIFSMRQSYASESVAQSCCLSRNRCSRGRHVQAGVKARDEVDVNLRCAARFTPAKTGWLRGSGPKLRQEPTVQLIRDRTSTPLTGVLFRDRFVTRCQVGGGAVEGLIAMMKWLQRSALLACRWPTRVTLLVLRQHEATRALTCSEALRVAVLSISLLAQEQRSRVRFNYTTREQCDKNSCMKDQQDLRPENYSGAPNSTNVTSDRNEQSFMSSTPGHAVDPQRRTRQPRRARKLNMQATWTAVSPGLADSQSDR